MMDFFVKCLTVAVCVMIVIPFATSFYIRALKERFNYQLRIVSQISKEMADFIVKSVNKPE